MERDRDLRALNRLIKEGCTSIISMPSGDRTDKGIVAVLSGYPAQPVTSIVKIPRKRLHCPTWLPYITNWDTALPLRMAESWNLPT